MPGIRRRPSQTQRHRTGPVEELGLQGGDRLPRRVDDRLEAAGHGDHLALPARRQRLAPALADSARSSCASMAWSSAVSRCSVRDSQLGDRVSVTVLPRLRSSATCRRLDLLRDARARSPVQRTAAPGPRGAGTRSPGSAGRWRGRPRLAVPPARGRPPPAGAPAAPPAPPAGSAAAARAPASARRRGRRRCRGRRISRASPPSPPSAAGPVIMPRRNQRGPSTPRNRAARRTGCGAVGLPGLRGRGGQDRAGELGAERALHLAERPALAGGARPRARRGRRPRCRRRAARRTPRPAGASSPERSVAPMTFCCGFSSTRRSIPGSPGSRMDPRSMRCDAVVRRVGGVAGPGASPPPRARGAAAPAARRARAGCGRSGCAVVRTACQNRPSRAGAGSVPRCAATARAPGRPVSAGAPLAGRQLVDRQEAGLHHRLDDELGDPVARRRLMRRRSGRG